MTNDTLAWLSYAEGLSAHLEPPRWRLLAHRRWRRYRQPDDVLRAVLAALRGEYEPINVLGVEASAQNPGIFDGERLIVRHENLPDDPPWAWLDRVFGQKPGTIHDEHER